MIQHFRILIDCVLSFKNGDNDLATNSFDEYYIPLVENKHFNAMIENEPVFEPLKIKQEVHEELVQNSRNNDNTTGNLLDLYASILQ